MIRESFERIMNEYPTYDVKEVFPFKDNPLADFIRQKLPEQFNKEFSEFPTIKWIASPGKGQWADAPWLAALDTLVTETPQEKYYPVFLFTRSLDAIFFSLNQGMTTLRSEFGDSQTIEILKHRARILVSRLSPEYKKLFTTTPINLDAGSPNSRLAFYEPGHAFGKMYNRDNLPSEDELNSDIRFMLELYQIVIGRGGVEEFDLGKPIDDSIGQDLANLTLEEKRRYRYHRTIERNPKLASSAKKIHGYICQVCNFNFEEVYGVLGSNYIEAHHRVPLSKLSTSNRINLSPKDDFAVVCANCHRMIHRSGAPEKFEDFVAFYHATQVVK